MGVFLVRRGKAKYVYVKNREVQKYFRVTDREGMMLDTYDAVLAKARKLDARCKPGTGTKHLYLVCSKNRTYNYEQLVFRAQPPGHRSKSFNINKLGYITAFSEARAYLLAHSFECCDVPHPSRYRDLIVKVTGELGYRSILKEYRKCKPCK